MRSPQDIVALSVFLNNIIVPWLRTQQADVPTTYHLDVLGLDLGGLLDKAEEIKKCGVTALTDNGCPSSSVSGRLFGGLTSIAGGIFSSLRSAATLTSAGGLLVGPTAQPTSSRSNEGGDHSISSTSDPHSPQPTMSSSGLLVRQELGSLSAILIPVVGLNNTFVKGHSL